jgi:hypothetical protein
MLVLHQADSYRCWLKCERSACASRPSCRRFTRYPRTRLVTMRLTALPGTEANPGQVSRQPSRRVSRRAARRRPSSPSKRAAPTSRILVGNFGKTSLRLSSLWRLGRRSLLLRGGQRSCGCWRGRRKALLPLLQLLVRCGVDHAEPEGPAAAQYARQTNAAHRWCFFSASSGVSATAGLAAGF